MTTTNPWGIHCVDCTVEQPCPRCAEQIAAEHAYLLRTRHDHDA
jgi:hypothetical protein